jgi:hypothetical protein
VWLASHAVIDEEVQARVPRVGQIGAGASPRRIARFHVERDTPPTIVRSSSQKISRSTR